MAREQILVVDDEEDILKLVEYNLAKEGFQVSCVTSGEEAVKAARSRIPDLMLLDLMLPGINGYTVTKTLKSDPATTPISIMILSAKGEEADVVTALELGADDYVVKPFSPRVLTARVRALLRRKQEATPSQEAVIRLPEIVIDPGRRKVILAGQETELTHTEFQLLHLLARRPGWVFTRNQIIDAVRGEDYAVTDRSVDVHVAGLRKKMGEAGLRIETIRGVGYRFKE